jgi:glucosamine--fructose-6-phosphate aminotransferase (isomerizing)
MERLLGEHLAAEIREQPAHWRRLAAGDAAQRLARALVGDVVLVGSGSSLFVAQLGALALRRRGIDAQAVPATEARLDNRAYRGRTLVAISQSGRSTDLLEALAFLEPRHTIALTNTPDSPLGARADVAIDSAAGPEIAVPATKSVSSMVLLLLWAASLVARDGHRDAAMLVAAADAVDAWFADGPSVEGVRRAAERIALRRSVVVLGSDYGLPIANETALKLKEASYVHAEGFAAGEFRHGSVAMVDASCAVIGIVDDDALAIVARPLREVEASEALRYTIGGPTVDAIERLGPSIATPFNTLGWLVTAQSLALYAARARHIDPDAPRGLTKALVNAQP